MMETLHLPLSDNWILKLESHLVDGKFGYSTWYQQTKLLPLLSRRANKFLCRLNLPSTGQYRYALQTIIANAIHASEAEECLQQRVIVRISSDKNNYRILCRYARIAGYKAHMSVLKALHNSGYITHVKGYHTKNSSRMGYYYATPLLLAFLKRSPVQEVIDMNKEVVELRDAAGTLVDYVDNSTTLLRREAISAIQSMFEKHKFLARGKRDLQKALQFKAVFNTSFDEGGRLYAPIQNFPKEERAFWTIDGEHLDDVDVKAIHPTYLYIDEGLTPPEDMYTVPGVERNTVKIALLILLNAKSKTAALRALISKGLAQNFQSGQKIFSQIELKHAEIAKYFYSGIGIYLQRRDSDLCCKIVLAAAKQNIPTIPFHDGWIVKHSNLKSFLKILNTELEAGLTYKVKEIGMGTGIDFITDRAEHPQSENSKMDWFVEELLHLKVDFTVKQDGIVVSPDLAEALDSILSVAWWAVKDGDPWSNNSREHRVRYDKLVEITNLPLWLIVSGVGAKQLHGLTQQQVDSLKSKEEVRCLLLQSEEVQSLVNIAQHIT